MANDPIVLILKITASAWKQEAPNGDEVRLWEAPPVAQPNTAARVTEKGIWPFKKYEWSVWSPFNLDNVVEEEPFLSGESAFKEDAMKAADEALKKLIASADDAGTEGQ